MQILIWCKLYFFLHFCCCLADRRLAKGQKKKERRLLFEFCLKGHLTTKMHWLDFSLEEENRWEKGDIYHVWWWRSRLSNAKMSLDERLSVTDVSVVPWGLLAYSACLWLNYWPGRRCILATDPWAEMGKWKTDMKRWAQSPFGPGGPIVLFIEGDRNGT